MAIRALIAVGGNSLLRAGEKGTIAEQLANTRRTAAAVVKLVRLGYRLVITHGNGPQVGAQLLRSERACDVVYGQPLDVCGAACQGEIGYYLAQSLRNELAEAGIDFPVASLVTQVLVSADDAALKSPTKPIGPFYSRSDAEDKKRLLGWHVVEDAARGCRRVVASPDPVAILEMDVIRVLFNRGVLVICIGGGGIPVMLANGRVQGVEAVIDKDRASALLATQLGMDLLAITTDTDCVYLNYREPGQLPLTHVTASQLEKYCKAGHFPAGSMGPKIESVLRFLRNGGKQAVITSHEKLFDAVTGDAGTHIFPDAGPEDTATLQELETQSCR